MKKKLILATIALACATAQGAWAWDGSGTAESPYIIASTADYATFAAHVNAGTDADKHYKLADAWDNSSEAVTATVGTEAHPFEGTFDGNGKTLHVSINDTQTHGTAPFSYVKGVTIENLTVAGSVTGTIHAAGLAGIVQTGGTTTVSGCTVRTTVNNSSGTGNGYVGGVVGHGTSATIVIENTVFSGYLNNTGDYAGGLVGWSGADITFVNSFFMGTHAGNSLFHPIALHHPDDAPRYTNNGAYYISTVPPTVADSRYIGLAGKPVYATQPDGEDYFPITAPDGTEYYVEALFYNVRSWDAENRKVVTTLTACTSYTVLSGTHEEDWIGLYDGYYVVKSATEYKVLNILGSNVHLIIADGVTLSCKHVKLEGSNKLHVHGCSNDTGILDVSNYAIGFSVNRNSLGETSRHKKNIGTFIEAAAIGGGGNTHMGSLYVHGGIINVTQGGRGAGIGGGEDAGIGGELVVYGGTVTVHCNGQKGNGAAIGGGEDHSQGGPVTIYGGTVKAYGILKGAGVGGEDGGHGGTVTVWGGYLYARGGSSGAGIGGGKYGNGGTVYIYDGRIRAINFDDDDQLVSACGIGGGMYGAGGDVHILGGRVESFGAANCSSIGAYGDNPLGTIEFADNMKVTAGNSQYVKKIWTGIPDRVFTNSEREAACQWRKWAQIEVCDHTTPTVGSDTTEPYYYTVDDDVNHTKHCRYCNVTVQEAHTGVDCVCGYTNSYKFTTYVPGATTDTYVEGATTTVGAGTKFLLPACPVVPAGYTFCGWEMNPVPEGINKWAYVLGDPLIQPQQTVEAVAGMSDATFYARFLYDFNTNWTWAANGSTASVTLSHADLSSVTLASTDDTPKVTITSDDLKETVTVVNNDESTSEKEEIIGTRYTATCTYTVDGNDYTFTDYKDVLTPEPVMEAVAVTLIDNADNTQTLWDVLGEQANVTLSGRTLYKDGSWNTLCLPFDVADISATQLAGATLKTLASSDYNAVSGTLTLNFADATAIEGGRPYLVKWTTTGDDITDPVFSGVTINCIMGGFAGSMYVDMLGTSSPVTLDEGDKSVLFLGAANTLYYPSADVTVGSCRAYFQLHNGLTAGDLPPQARAFVLNFGDGETTGIKEIVALQATEPSADATHSPYTAWEGSGCAWYTLDGRRLSGKPTMKGLYINNGRKVVMK